MSFQDVMEKLPVQSGREFFGSRRDRFCALFGRQVYLPNFPPVIGKLYHACTPLARIGLRQLGLGPISLLDMASIPKSRLGSLSTRQNRFFIPILPRPHHRGRGPLRADGHLNATSAIERVRVLVDNLAGHSNMNKFIAQKRLFDKTLVYGCSGAKEPEPFDGRPRHGPMQHPEITTVCGAVDSTL
jgi:hypothetical protein